MDKKSCEKGDYYCYTSKKCKPIPTGYRVDSQGMLVSDKDSSIDEGTKSGDHEVSMAQSQLKKSEQNIRKLRKVIGKKEKNIPAWVQAKITDTEHNTDAASSYMDEGKRDGKSAKDSGYSLKDWFKGGGWVQAGGKYDGKPCAKQPGQTTKPFCRDADDRASMSKDERERRAKKKRIEDPNPNRKGKAKMVNASYSNWRSELVQLDEFLGGVPGDGYYGHPNLDIKNPFAKTQKKEKVLPKAPPAGAPGSGGLLNRTAAQMGDRNTELQKLLQQSYEPEGEQIDEKCWKGYKKKGMKTMFGKRYPNCVKEDGVLVDEGKKDACYNKVKSRYSVWPSAYASGALVKCRNVGAANWGNKSESINLKSYDSLSEASGESRYCPKCEKNETRNECSYGVKYWDKFSLPPSVSEAKVKRWWDDDGDGIGYEEGEVKKSKKKKTRKEEYYNWREELLEQKGYVMPNASKTGAYSGGDPKSSYRVGDTIPTSAAKPKPNTQKLIHSAGDKYGKAFQEDWQKVNKGDKTDGMSPAAVKAYRRENPGSKLKTAVIGDPKPGSKDAKRRKSFCARSKGQQDMHNIDCSSTPDKPVCKARRRWKC